MLARPMAQVVAWRARPVGARAAGTDHVAVAAVKPSERREDHRVGDIVPVDGAKVVICGAGAECVWWRAVIHLFESEQNACDGARCPQAGGGAPRLAHPIRGSRQGARAAAAVGGTHWCSLHPSSVASAASRRS
eukprot:3040654-Prymnesium_polylepis.2